ncbi:WD repeat-containing protein 49-like [Arapaima gigas]
METTETERKEGLLENRLSVEDFAKMQSLFLPAETGAPASLTRAEFAERACAAVGRGSWEEYGRLFDSADVWREGRLDWERLTSFLLLGLSEKEEHARATAVPRWSSLRLLPALHRDSIQQVAHLRSSSRYLSISKEGVLGVWADDLVLLKSHRVSTDSVKPKDLWVTGMAVLHNVHKVAVSFTSKEICIFDLLSKPELSCQYKVQGLRHAAVSLDYWSDPQTPDEGVLSFGDLGGQVSAICFRTAQICLFERPGAGEGKDAAAVVVKWAELLQGRHRCCYTLGHHAHHLEWVRRVKFLGNLEAFVSCTTSEQNSLVVAWREQEATRLRVTAAHIEGGTSDLDYHRGLNLIATAGLDGRVLLWNPYVVSKPVGVLRGHVTSVVGVHFLPERKQLVSFSKDQVGGACVAGGVCGWVRAAADGAESPQVLRVWDVHHQLSVQRLAGVFPRTQECRTLLLFHEERGRFFLTFNTLLTLLEDVKEAERQVTSHEHVVTCVLYNSVLKQVISSDVGSTVICWLTDTGQKVKQFTRCHGNAEITAMALDATQTRLFTGGTDGLVKVWDFNGHCHHKLDAGRTRAVDISQILVLKRMLLVLGWSRTLTVFRPSSSSSSQFSPVPCKWTGGSPHRDHILCAAFLPPQTLVTGFCDGEIMVWNSSTENVLRKLELKNTLPLQSRSDSELLNRPTAHTLAATSQLFGAPGGAEDPQYSPAVTQLLFLEGRNGAAAAGGANLVSCGSSNLVHFWNTKQGCLVAQFITHQDSTSITMTADKGGKYLVTGDVDGEVRVWDVQDYCLRPHQAAAGHSPELLGRSRPHTDCVTHLETCVHGGRLFLLSASADCRVVLSLLPGAIVGTFGQEQHWRLDTIPENPQPSGVPTEDRERALPSRLHGNGTLDTGPQSLSGDTLVSVQDGRSDPLGTVHLSGSVPCRRCSQEGRSLRVKDSRLHPAGKAHACLGTFSSLHIKDLASVGEFTKPDFVANPHLYFGDRSDCPSNSSPALPTTVETVRVIFDERSLFPRKILEPEEGPEQKRDAQVKRNPGQSK